MGTFTQYNPNALWGEVQFSFNFKTTRGLIQGYEKHIGKKLESGWQYCIKEMGDFSYLMKFSLKEDSWIVLGYIKGYPKEIKLPKFEELFKKRRVIR